MKWFRLYHEFATDPKIQSLSEADQRRYIMLLCLKGNGDLNNLNDKEIALALRISTKKLEKTKEIFLKKKLVDENWIISGWDKRQYISDSSTERTKKWREKQPSQGRHGDDGVTRPDTDTDTDTDTEKDKTLEKRPKARPDKSKKFKKPTRTEILDYTNSIGYNLEPERFIDYYESNGWMVGKSPMKNWQACVRTWRGKDSKTSLDSVNKGEKLLAEAKKDSRHCSALYEKDYLFYEAAMKDHPNEWEELRRFWREKWPSEEKEEMVDSEKVRSLLEGLGKAKSFPTVTEEEL